MISHQSWDFAVLDKNLIRWGSHGQAMWKPPCKATVCYRILPFWIGKSMGEVVEEWGSTDGGWE